MCDLVLSASLTGTSLASRLEAIPYLLEQAMKDEAFFGYVTHDSLPSKLS
jgi:hypothetical protein